MGFDVFCKIRYLYDQTHFTLRNSRIPVLNLDKLLLTISLLALSLTAFAQSGRVKPSETPTPKPTPRQRVVYMPTEKTQPFPTISPTPTPKPKTEDDDVITVESNLVPIPVSVLDAGGLTVRNLKLEDFLLQIDGQTAEIGELSRSETPVRLALLFDNSSSVTIAREFEKKAAVRFFRRVIRPEKDLVALFSVSTVSRLEQPLTKDVSLLIQAIEAFAMPTGATALLDGMIEAADYLKEAQGRRVIVIVSDGDDTVSDSTFEQTLKALQLGNCQVYIVKTTDFENFKRTGQRGGNANIRQLAAERRMQEFAAQTGGAVYSPIDEDELDRAFNQISAELSQQYVLSYYPESEADKRGQFRTISLKVKNRENLTVRTRKGYYVPRK
jgi:Ca-activated chloride channel homolog